MFLWCIRLLNTAPSFMEEPKTCNSCKIEYLKLKKCCLKKPTFFSQGVINEEVANIAWVPSSFMAGLQIQMEVSVCSKGKEGLQEGSSPLWFEHSWSPKALMAGGLTPVTILFLHSCALPQPSAPAFLLTEGWLRWSFGSTLASLVPFPGLLFADCKQEEKANKGSLLLASLWGSLLHINVSTRMQSNANTSEGCYCLKLGRAAEEWLSAWFLSHGIKKEIQQSG